jgi:hypothetical protein
VVDEDGLVVPVSKCLLKELRAEAEARGMDAADMKRPELTSAIKVGCLLRRWHKVVCRRAKCRQEIAL